MTTVGVDYLTLTDWASRKDPDGGVAAIIEQLALRNPILQDMPFIEGNLPTGHKTTIRTGLPSATWRMLNYGVANSKARTAQVTDTTGMLEAFSDIDKSLITLNGNSKEFRASEDMAFLQAMNNEVAETLFYGNTDTDPEKFLGLSPRYSVISTDSSESGYNIIDGAGSDSDNASIWLVVWGPQTCHGIFPKGSKVGLTHTDLGEQILYDASGNKYMGVSSHFKWDIGLTVRDWRYVVRIANIDVSDLHIDGTTGDSENLSDLMTQALEQPPDLEAGRPVFYCGKKIRTWLRRQATSKSNVNLTLDDYMGRKVVSFDGVPVQKCESLTVAEEHVTT